MNPRRSPLDEPRFPGRLATVGLVVVLAGALSVHGHPRQSATSLPWRTGEPGLELGPAERLEVDPCAAQGPVATLVAPECASLRRVWVDFDELGVPGRAGIGVIRYDFDLVTRPLLPQDLATEPELSVAVRLLLSEIGPDRMLASAEALDEAIGILYTVDNRLDRIAVNPDDRPDAPHFPGCGPGGTFATCANPGEYLGMATWRALDPQAHYEPDLLEPAVDLAAYAWYLQERGYSSDPTGGATSYVHRCGGAAYGEPTWRCDGHLGRPGGDIAGASPHTGPIVFLGPEVFLEHRGHYILHETRAVDYEPWPSDGAFGPVPQWLGEVSEAAVGTL